MSVLPLVKGDFRLQLKYGFCGLYLLLSALYIGVLLLLPQDIRRTAATLMIFSDPAAMGLFFLGAMVLFEKSQRVVCSLAVAPITPRAYVLSKLLSLSVISTGAAFAIFLFMGGGLPLLSLLAGVFLSSLLFSAVGMLLAARAATLNGFLLSTIPAELVIMLPAAAYMLGFSPAALLAHPGVCAIVLLSGADHAIPAFFVLLLWTAGFFCLAVKAAGRMFVKTGGADK